MWGEQEKNIEAAASLMADAIASYALFESDAIIIDFGTALTFTLLRKDGKLEGVNIVPGLKTAIRALGVNAAQLHDVDLVKPISDVGSNTVEAIQNGILIGYKGLVSHMVETISSSCEGRCYIVATGGLSEVIEGIHYDVVNKNLTLDGLKWVADHLIRRIPRCLHRVSNNDC